MEREMLRMGNAHRSGTDRPRALKRIWRAVSEVFSSSASRRVWAEPLEARQLLSGSVVINEIMHHPAPSDLGAEYIELYNAGDAPVDLAGWKLKGVGYTFGPATIGAGQYLVVAADLASFHAKYPTVSNVVGAWTDGEGVVHEWAGRLSNSREQVELEDAAGKRVDVVDYADQGEWAVRERSRGVKGVDGITASGTTATVTLTSHGYRNGDQVEIFGADQPEYNGLFTVANAKPNTFDILLSGSPVTPATGTMFSRQKTDRGHTGWTWLQWADGLGSSLELINPALDNNQGQNWASSIVRQGTPGASNSVARNDVAPMILDAVHSPAVPRSSDAVTVTARMEDELSGGISAAVYWRVDGDPDFAVTSMFDDGQHGDGDVGDGLWGAVLPPQANNTVVEFYLSATDPGGQQRTWPASASDGEQAANLLYQVDDTAYTGAQPLFKLIMTEAERAELASIGAPGSSSRDSDAQMNATIIAADGSGTEIRYLTGIRNRGAGSRDQLPNNYHINFNTDRLWRGLSALNLNGRYSMEEIAGSAVFRAAGLPAQDAVPVQVRVNNANLAASDTTHDMYGSYSLVEVPNTEMVENHWPEDSSGNYYRGIRRLYGNSPLADLSYRGEDPNAYRQDYEKHSNVEDDDWTDLINLSKAFDRTLTSDAAFPDAIRQVLDVDQWLRYFALSTLIGDQETTLSTGYGDDYDLYSGSIDQRFQVIVHDLDTVLGVGDTSPKYEESIFRAIAVPAVERLLTHPAFAPLYYAQLKELIDTVFAPDRISEILNHAVGSYVPASKIEVMTDFVDKRINGTGGVLSQIPLALTATSTLPVQNGYLYTADAVTSLSGQSDVIRTRTVLVDGKPATWAWDSAKRTWIWSAGNIALRPGLNRIVVQSLDEQGQAFARSTVDILRDATTATVGGTLPAGTTTWTAAGGPYRVTSNVTVPAGATLVIEPGTTVYFNAGTGISVSGRLVAEGTDAQRIRFTRTPGATANWNGIQFSYTQYSEQDNRITYADIEYADASGRAIKAQDARLLLDHLRFANHTRQYLMLDDSSVIISNSVFPDVANAELIHYWGFPSNGYARIEGNWFGKTTGYNDIIDFTGGQRPGPIAQFLNNVFTGGGDDAIDLDGTDAHVEGNVFMHFHQTSPHESQSHGVSTGTEMGLTSDVTIVRNLFYDMDHAILIKDGGFGTIINNTIVNIHNQIDGATTAAINLYEVRGSQWQGSGVYLDGNIFQDVSRLFENPDWAGHPVDISVNRSIYAMIPGEPAWPGEGNLHVDPRLANTDDVTDPLIDFRLLPGSPAIGAGPNGLDMGALVSPGASISGEPVSSTWINSATLTVGGPDIYGYKYRVNDGPWSGEVKPQSRTVSSISLGGTRATAVVPGHGFQNGDMVNISGASPADYNGNFMIRNVTADTFDYTVPPGTSTSVTGTITVTPINGSLPPIELAGLADGTYTVYVIRKNSAGVWQSEAEATASRTWAVNSQLGGRVRINEVLVRNTTTLARNGTLPDVIELYNPGQDAVDLSDMSITDNADQPRKFVFPAGTVLEAGAYLLLYADNAAVPGELHLGFWLKDDGDQVSLFRSPADGGSVADSVSFGRQLPDYSIGRDADGTWRLNRPTLGEANIVQPVGATSRLQINEWLTDQRVLFTDDFVEIFNADALPVDIGGLYLTDNPSSPAHRAYIHQLDPQQQAPHAIPPLSFVAGRGVTLFIADGQVHAGANHLDFVLSSLKGVIGLLDPQFEPIDVVVYGPQRPDISEGRTPNGDTEFVTFELPHPGVNNPGITVDTRVEETVTPLYDLGNAIQQWRISESGSDLGTAWRDPGYNDSDWRQGAGLLGYRWDGQNLPQPGQVTTLAGNPDNLDSSKHPRPYTTYYFRTHFTLSVDPAQVTTLAGQLVADDGAVIYLNGREIYRIGMSTSATVDYGTWANRTVGTGSLESYSIRLSDLPAGTLRAGDNVIAVEVHQANSGSSDVAFGMSLDARKVVTTTTTTITDPIPDNVQNLMKHLRITEVMYDPIGGNEYEYIELKNTSASTALDLAGLRLTNGVDFVFPAIPLAPGEYVLVVADRAAFESRYGTNLNIAGQYAGHLNGDGEGITLKLPSPYEAAILRFTYRGDWYPSTQGQGRSLVIDNPLGQQAEWSSRLAWRASIYAGGSPGAADQGTSPGAVVINEVLPDSSRPDGSWIELHNTTQEPLDISGWYLSDDQASLLKYQLPTNSIIPEGGYLVIDQQHYFGNALQLKKTGGAIYLTSGAASGGAGDYRESAVYSATDRDGTAGRYTNSVGKTAFVSLSTPTRGGANADPQVGPVVMSELMYHPAGGDEFIELRNLTGMPVALYDAASDRPWMFTAGVDFSFGKDAAIPALGYALVVPIQPEIFRAKYDIPAGVPIFGPYTGALNNGGEEVALSRPANLQGGAVPLPYILVDRLWYDNNAPWPTTPDGQGASLARLAMAQYGDDPANWTAEPTGGSPGRTNLLQAIAGSPGNDAYYLRVNGTNLEVFLNADPRQPSPPVATYSYPLNGVGELRIDAGAGNDSVTILSSLPFMPIFDAGTGNDTLTVLAGTYDLASDQGDRAAATLNMIIGGDAAVNFAASQHLASLSIAGNARVSLKANGARVLRTGGLSISGDGILDLADNDLILQSTADRREADLAALGAWIASGRQGGTWQGAGITSSAAANDAAHLTGLASMLNTAGGETAILDSFAGEGVDASSILVRYTRNGDMDLNDVVDADDYFWIDRGLLKQGTGYRSGDLDYSGTVDADDYMLIDRSFAGQVGVLSAGTSPLAAVAVPQQMMAEGTLIAPAKKMISSKDEDDRRNTSKSKVFHEHRPRKSRQARHGMRRH